MAELAKSDSLQPLYWPGEASEPGYSPSAKLADFVRCRDLTCRAPGCDQPAVVCDLDHTVAYWMVAGRTSRMSRASVVLVVGVNKMLGRPTSRRMG